jgi:hypothetical protein
MEEILLWKSNLENTIEALKEKEKLGKRKKIKIFLKKKIKKLN